MESRHSPQAFRAEKYHKAFGLDKNRQPGKTTQEKTWPLRDKFAFISVYLSIAPVPEYQAEDRARKKAQERVDTAAKNPAISGTNFTDTADRHQHPPGKPYNLLIYKGLKWHRIC